MCRQARCFFFAVVGCLLVALMAEAAVLGPGDKGREVLILQEKLARLGFFRAAPTGYFGRLTQAAVKDFQRACGLKIDGIAGPQTMAAIEEVLSRQNAQLASRGGRTVLLLPWELVNKMWPRGTTARVYDIETGISFLVRRLYGTEHADVEPLTKQDTYLLKQIYGGRWSWDRRAIVVELEGRYIAASMNGMPHGGQAIYDNDFPGQFCIHFLGSRLHKNRKVDAAHQSMVLRAARTGLRGVALPAEEGEEETPELSARNGEEIETNPETE
ncbi:MAG: peptidoglycan-binding domain-containing protein [Bacillota bacterium]